MLVGSCIFERLDGNGIIISGYNYDVTEKLICMDWGHCDCLEGIHKWYQCARNEMVGTDGNQLRFNRILNNFVHELGIWEKQSSFYFQAKSCQNILNGNVFFSGPYTGINFNDSFGSAKNITKNLILNTCNESSDYGPFQQLGLSPTRQILELHLQQLHDH